MSSPTIRCIQDKHNVDLEKLERPAMIQFNSIQERRQSDSSLASSLSAWQRSEAKLSPMEGAALRGGKRAGAASHFAILVYLSQSYFML